METFYLVDFENVHNEGFENIESLSKTEHVHIFSTKNAPSIRMDIAFSQIDMEGHIVPARKQSVDMHLVSYLGYLLGAYGKQCAYVIVSKDTDYDNIIKFWKEKGYSNISRKQKIKGTATNQKKTMLSGNDRSKLNIFVQQEIVARGYPSSVANRICKYVIAHCNDETMLSGIHNDLKEEYEDYLEIYGDVKVILEKFKTTQKRESQVRSFFGQHFRKKIYVDNRDEIIKIIINAKTKQQINNDLQKLYKDNNAVKYIYQTIQPLIKDLPSNTNPGI